MTHPAPEKEKGGVWSIDQTVMEDLGTERGEDERGSGGYTVRRSLVHMGGQPSKRAHNLAVAAMFDDGIPTVDAQLQVLASTTASATILTVDHSGGVQAREGKLMNSHQGLAFLKKGSGTKGHYINDTFRPLSVVPGFNRADAIAAEWWAMDAVVPQVRNADFDAIPEYQEEGEREELIHAVFLMHYPDFNGGYVAGCMFLATDVQTDECPAGYEIANGYLWAPADCSLTPEHGSQYLKDCELRGGRVTNFTPGRLTFAECVNENIPGNRREAYAYVLGAKS